LVFVKVYSIINCEATSSVLLTTVFYQWGRGCTFNSFKLQGSNTAEKRKRKL